MSARTRAFIMLTAVAAIWGFASPIIKFALPHFPPLIFLTYRFLISAVIMLPLLLYLEPDTFVRLGRLPLTGWFWLVVSGILGSTVQLTLLFLGLNLTTVIDSTVINAISPLFVAAAGYLFLKEHLQKNEIIGLVLASFGTVVIILQPIFEGQSFFSGSLLGNLLVLLGTFAWVGYVILTKKQLNHRISPLFLTTNMFIVGFFTESLLLFYFSTPQELIFQFTTAPWSAHLSVIYMAIFSGTLAYYLYQKAQKLIEVSEANLILHLSPLFAIPLSYFWLKEVITLPFIVGGVIIALGVTISEFGRKRLKHVV